MKYTSFYFSRILNLNVFTVDFQVMGKVIDMAVTSDIQNPQVFAVIVKTPDGIKNLDFKQFIISKRDNKYHLSCLRSDSISIENSLLLKKNILDKQIIDVNGRKVVRVNDIRLSLISNVLYVIAVDIGVEGLLRRLGVNKFFNKTGLKLNSRLIFWSDIETVHPTSESLVLSKTYDKLSIMHPSDLADIIEDFDTQTGMMIFSKLGNEKGADVLEEMDEDTQKKVIENLSPEKAADILEEMPSDEAADILEVLEESKAEELLSEMEQETQDEIRELMQYEENIIGSIMSTDFLSFPSDTTVADTIKFLKENKPEEGLMNDIFITNQKSKLIGKVTLRDLILAEEKDHLKSLMHKDFIYMLDTDEKEKLIDVAIKYNLLSVPVVDHEMHIVGCVIIHDILDEVINK